MKDIPTKIAEYLSDINKARKEMEAHLKVIEDRIKRIVRCLDEK